MRGSLDSDDALIAMFLIAVLLIAVLLAFVTGYGGTDYDDVAPIAVEGTEIRAVEVEEYGVVCFIYTGYKKGGLSCLPRSEVR